MQPKFLEVQIARIGAVFKRSKLEMDAVFELEENVTKRWEPLLAPLGALIGLAF